ncbi:amino acid adenylation domain-containing protein [Streptomyces sp. PRB2-1]|uniref:Amino acid adenylation domain-containing protein n=1 Tax=Actinacidiphila epipremni TaxID=2053013 RepID=A0ABX0ZN17_9ACTN|nr:amino acid adenylation domain-containing protein [Actinacidiphila epipremni]
MPGAPPGLLPDLLAAQALARPGDIAVVCEGESLTFRELADQAEDMARFLRHLGVGPDTPVGVFVEPSLELMTGVWGVLRSGGGYLPLAPDYPPERIRHIARDAGVRVVITQDALRHRLADVLGTGPGDGGPEVVTPDDVVKFTRGSSAADPAGPLDRPGPADLAYVIYTSGSTGRPKGVAIEHRSIAHQMDWLGRTFGLGPRSTVLLKSPVSFDAAQWEILAPACGSRVVVGAGGIHRDPARLVETVVRYGVTVLQGVPTLLRALVETDELHRCRSLTHLFSGGEALSRTLAAKVTGALPGTALVNLYGPTECTINTSAHVVDPAALRDGPDAVPIGTPVSGLRYHILDTHGRPVPPGQTGELHISGVQLARGYLGRPDLTADRFRPAADFPGIAAGPGHERLYRTGDLAQWNPDGTAQFAGRADNQVKLHGFRIELDEVCLAIEAHDWVKNAAVLLHTDARTGIPSLVACVELSPREAALMDQGEHADHHVSKSSKLQVRAQLSDPGVRPAADLAGRPAVPLPGAAASPEQRRLAFARKTYRFYEGGTATPADLLDALGRRTEGAPPRRPQELTLGELGAILRNFGQHRSQERLLPKYAYASPGSLYAAQLYVEAGGLPGLAPGTYYYHPVGHELVLVRAHTPAPGLRVHLVGHRAAIEPVYKKNIWEVLEIEAGHMAGLFDHVLPAHGLGLDDAPRDPGLPRLLGCAEGDRLLASFALAPRTPAHALPPAGRLLDAYVQIHPGGGTGLPSGQYRYEAGALHRIGAELVLKRHVIAINQAVYERASFGVTFVSRAADGNAAGGADSAGGNSTGRADGTPYVDLGRGLQHLMTNDSGLGFMSAGYSSRGDDDLPAARRMAVVLRGAGRPAGPSYFCVGGKVSDEQLRHEGMHEDQVHMKGPAELIREDLAAVLPQYMLPARILVLPALPHTPSGKVDRLALAARVEEAAAQAGPPVEPRNRVEERLCALWRSAMRRDHVAVHDDFFGLGGNSLVAVALMRRVNEAFGCGLPPQTLFEAPTVARLAEAVTAGTATAPSRLAPLRAGDGGAPVFCWPGLGGFTMNLRLLAARAPGDRPVYGVQSFGLNEGESPYASLEQMAAADIAALREVQPAGPYTLWGYSFGARVAFETAWQLEQAGERVERLFLLAPGSPRVGGVAQPDGAGAGAAAAVSVPGASAAPVTGPAVADFADPVFTTILFSVFAARVGGPGLAECLREATDAESFALFVERAFPQLDPALIRRVVAVVRRTYGLGFADADPAARRIQAPVTVFRARGDEPSFLERAPGRTVLPPTVVPLEADHYGALRDPGVDELAKALRRAERRQDPEPAPMPVAPLAVPVPGPVPQPVPQPGTPTERTPTCPM